MNGTGSQLEAALQGQLTPPARRLSLDEGNLKNGLGSWCSRW
jgi:hypothetical protein